MKETNGSYRAAVTEDVRAHQVPDEVEIAVVGAGATGLTAAAMLAGYGPPVLRNTPVRPSFTRGRWRPSWSTTLCAAACRWPCETLTPAPRSPPAASCPTLS